jgi:L-2-hydroxyglutarate oxidase LhgO
LKDHGYKTLDILIQNAIQNGVPAEFIDEKQLTELEPYAHPASKAIYCPTTSVIDNKAVLKKLKSVTRLNLLVFLFNFTSWFKLNNSCKKIINNFNVYTFE